MIRARQDDETAQRHSESHAPPTLDNDSGRQLARLAVLIVVVAVLVAATHWPAMSAQALSLDDAQYLTDNPLVQSPGWRSAARFMTEVLEPSTVDGYYQPLTMISLMLDYAIGGRHNHLGPFHRTSLTLHVLNTALIIVLLHSLFGQAMPAALVGLLFGVHPLTVEPVTWVGDRKTLLATFFALWCLLAYVAYAQRRGSKWLVTSLVMYLLAMMSKPTTVLLPVLLLLADYWPLKRLKLRVVIEKAPFVVLGGIFAVIILISQARTGGMMASGESNLLRIPLVVCHLIIFYLCKIVWPTNLSSVYPLPHPLSLSNAEVLIGVVGTGLLIAGLLLSLVRTRALLSGWLFFLVAILPTMGVVQFSWVTASDKYVYFPAIGLLMILAWGLAPAWEHHRHKTTLPKAGLVVLVLLLSTMEARGVRQCLVHWQDTERLFRHLVSVAPQAFIPRNNLGNVLAAQGKLDEAIGHYREALRIKPDYADAHNDLGNALAEQGRLYEAISHYRQALTLKPAHAKAHNNLAIALRSQGKYDEAISHYRQALRITPDVPEIHLNLGVVLRMTGRLNEASEHFQEAVRLKPALAGVLRQHGLVPELVRPRTE